MGTFFGQDMMENASDMEVGDEENGLSEEEKDIEEEKSEEDSGDEDEEEEEEEEEEGEVDEEFRNAVKSALGDAVDKSDSEEEVSWYVLEDPLLVDNIGVGWIISKRQSSNFDLLSSTIYLQMLEISWNGIWMIRVLWNFFLFVVWAWLRWWWYV